MAVDSVSLADAAIPMVGLTALRTLRSSGSLLNRRVLIGGASGGIGRAAFELAALGGAVAPAATASSDRAERLRELGAAHVVGSLDKVTDPQDVARETVGVEAGCLHREAGWHGFVDRDPCGRSRICRPEGRQARASSICQGAVMIGAALPHSGCDLRRTARWTSS